MGQKTRRRFKDRKFRRVVSTFDRQSIEELGSIGSFPPTRTQRFLIWAAQNSVLGRGEFRPHMARLIQSIQSPIDLVRGGCAFRLSLKGNLIETGLCLKSNYNGPEIEFLKSTMGPGKLALDIGCNIGMYTLPLAQTGARVISIDANGEMARRTKFHLEANGLEGQVLHLAVGDKNGQVILESQLHDMAIVRTVESDAGDVEMKPLAQILAEQNVQRVDALKIDIEGFEDKALAPWLFSAERSQLPKRIVIEMLPEHPQVECQAAFDQLGYRKVGNTKVNSMFELD